MEKRMMLWALGILGGVFFSSVAVAVWLFEQYKGPLEGLEKEVKEIRPALAVLQSQNAALREDVNRMQTRYDSKLDTLLEQVAQINGKLAAGGRPKK